jgi:DNA (cytosine-5)-methyltransferase 1
MQGEHMKSLELFAGIGGIALAAEWAGIEPVAFCEREPFCQKVLNKHWSNVPIFDDVCTLNKKTLEERGVDVGTIELISGGFPCQPYSIAGKRKGTTDDRDLWPEMFRIIEEIKPRWVVGENVANFVNMELDRTLFDLESIDYETQSFVIPACSVDAKHQRNRVFVVAHSRCKLRERGSVKREDGMETRKQNADFFERSSEMVPNSASIGLQGQGEFIKPINSTENREGETSEPFDVCKPSKWSAEPNVGRVAHGIPHRVDRLRGLGNAVVPQQIYPIFKTIMEIERMNNK